MNTIVRNVVIAGAMVAVMTVGTASARPLSLDYTAVKKILRSNRSVCKVVRGPRLVKGVPSAGTTGPKWLVRPKKIRRGEWGVIRPIKVMFHLGDNLGGKPTGKWNNGGEQTLFVARGVLPASDYNSVIKMLKTNFGFGKCIAKRGKPNVEFIKPYYIRKPYGIVTYRAKARR